MSDLRVVAVAVNIPGPLAAEHFASQAASVEKIEPLSGDPLESAAPGWYARISSVMHVRRLDLRASQARRELDELLERADLLFTAMRPAALERLALDPDACIERFPRLCHVAITGESGRDAGLAGHDLTYQARTGLLAPPAMPRTVFADMFAAQAAITHAYRLLYRRERGGTGGVAHVAIADAAAPLGDALRFGLTTAGGPLGGALPEYRLYRAADGWIALAALEPHFQENLRAALGIERLDAGALAQIFEQRTLREWEQLARERDIPLAAVA